MAKTSKERPTNNTGTKKKKSTSQKTVGGKSSKNELPSSPTRSRSDRAAHRGAALLNPTDVDDPALSAVNPSFSEINYDVACPGAALAHANAIGDNILLDKTVGTKGINVNPSLSEINCDVASPGAALAQANAIGHNILLDKTVGTKGIELNNSNNDNYRGDVYDDDYSNGEESLGKYRVPSARGKGSGRKPKAGRPPKPDTTGMSTRDAFVVMSDWERSWKRDSDVNRRTAAAAAALQDFDESLDPFGEQFTGVCSKTLWEMKDVEQRPLRKGDTFPNKETVMI